MQIIVGTVSGWIYGTLYKLCIGSSAARRSFYVSLAATQNFDPRQWQKFFNTAHPADFTKQYSKLGIDICSPMKPAETTRQSLVIASLEPSPQ